jgi:hypothetical protein
MWNEKWAYYDIDLRIIPRDNIKPYITIYEIDEATNQQITRSRIGKTVPCLREGTSQAVNVLFRWAGASLSVYNLDFSVGLYANEVLRDNNWAEPLKPRERQMHPKRT